MRQLRIGGYPVTIDRPRGTPKQFQTLRGPVLRKYPMDYGYFDTWLNSQDGEGADVFVGTEPEGLYGRFSKGTDLSGYWKPDEWKWYAGLDHKEFAALVEFWDSQAPGLAREYTNLGDPDGLINDLSHHCVWVDLGIFHPEASAVRV